MQGLAEFFMGTFLIFEGLVKKVFGVAGV